ncbi:HAD-like domain-containing protein [Flammula alnicola]|nr:HAD-like domain-containing protein [Flammula alnicola]
MSSAPQIFYADAVLFDMDGTLTDSISAVEAAWAKVAKDIGQDPEHVIAATHGKRAIDNLSQFKPQLKDHEIEAEVERFENTILYYADAHRLHRDSIPLTPEHVEHRDSHHAISYASSSDTTPDFTPGPTGPSSRHLSTVDSHVRRPSFGNRLLNMLSLAARLRAYEETFKDAEDEDMIRDGNPDVEGKPQQCVLEAWQLEAASVDRAVRILPGVRRILDSIPAGRYAVATSGAKTYAYGCMKRVGITPPQVTITADDKRLKAGKPAPDPFLLAADCLGYDAKRCVVFEDSPSGIRAGVASGATVIAVCTSHDHSKLEDCGAHFIVENMDYIVCEVEGDRLKFTISPTPV